MKLNRANRKLGTNRIVIGLVGGIVLIGVLFAARSLGVALGGHPTAEPLPLPSDSTTTTTSAAMTTVEAPTTTTISESVHEEPPSESLDDITDGGTSAQDEPLVTVGKALTSAAPPVAHVDQVEILGGEVPAGMVFSSTPSSGGSPFETQLPDSANKLAGPERGFGVGVEIDTDGHYAKFIVGISSGPNGLDSLTIHFGDGSEPYEMPRTEVDRFGDLGTVEVTHRFEPSVESRLWPFVVVEATDRFGAISRIPLTVETSARFLVSYSPLSVTALDACDGSGDPGDFTLRWNNAGRDQSSRFNLLKGETHIEDSFRAAVDGPSEGFPKPVLIAVEERDGKEIRFGGMSMVLHADRLPSWTEVLSLGAHTLDVSSEILADDDGVQGTCVVEARYQVSMSLDDRPNR